MLDFAILFYAAFYGFTMKVADLLDEHGLKLFKGADLLFGFFWGLFGALLVFSDLVVANIVLAMNLAFIIRLRLDYLNHSIAASIIILAFLFTVAIQPVLFFAFYLVFVLFGGMKDLLDDFLKQKGLLQKLSETMWYYPVPTLAYGILYGNYLPFAVFTIYTLAYNLTKTYFPKKRAA